MKNLILLFWLVLGLSVGFAKEPIDDFVKELERVIQTAGPDDLRGITLAVPENREVIRMVFLPEGYSLVDYELISLDEAKVKWPTIVPRVIDSLAGVQNGDLVLRMSWSKMTENGEASIKQTFIVSKKEDGFKLRLELKK